MHPGPEDTGTRIVHPTRTRSDSEPEAGREARDIRMHPGPEDTRMPVHPGPEDTGTHASRAGVPGVTPSVGMSRTSPNWQWNLSGFIHWQPA
jgi:hypothetical protein